MAVPMTSTGFRLVRSPAYAKPTAATALIRNITVVASAMAASPTPKAVPMLPYNGGTIPIATLSIDARTMKTTTLYTRCGVPPRIVTATRLAWSAIYDSVPGSSVLLADQRDARVLVHLGGFRGPCRRCLAAQSDPRRLPGCTVGDVLARWRHEHRQAEQRRGDAADRLAARA